MTTVELVSFVHHLVVTTSSLHFKGDKRMQTVVHYLESECSVQSAKCINNRPEIMNPFIHRSCHSTAQITSCE